MLRKSSHKDIQCLREWAFSFKVPNNVNKNLARCMAKSANFLFNSFIPNGIYVSYQLYQSICVLIVVERYFSFLFRF